MNAIAVALVATLWAVAGCSQPERATPKADASATPSAVTSAAVDDAEVLKMKAEYKKLALENDCSEGFQGLNGTWRFKGDTKTPDYEETLTVTGTRFVNVLHGRPDGKTVDATIKGEIRCLYKNRVLVQVDKVEPEGAFGNRSGDAYPCDLLGDLAASGNNLYMNCFFEWDMRVSAGLDFEYERVQKQ